MDTELYIDGTRVDVSGTVSMTWKSNLFGDVSKITSNRSNTITLPHTARNEKVFQFADIPTVQSDKVRCYLDARLVIDGVEIFRNGLAVLMKGDADGYEVALTWGIISGYKTMNTEAKKLGELDWGSMCIEIPTTIRYSQRSDTAEAVWSKYRSGYDGDGSYPKIMPCIKAKTILDKIGTQYGLVFDIPTDRLSRLRRMLVPMVTLNRGTKAVAFTSRNYRGDIRLDHTEYTITKDGNKAIRLSPIQTPAVVESLVDGEYALRITATAGTAFSIYLLYGDTTKNYTATQVGTQYTIDVTADITVEKGNSIRIETASDVSLEINAVGTVESESDLAIGCNAYYADNLPDMTCIEFIKEICVRLDIIPINSDSTTVLRFTTWEAIYTSTPRVLEDTEGGTVEYTLSDTAQRNIYKYLTDDYCVNDFSGEVVCANPTLDATREAFTSKFVGVIDGYIQLYTITATKDSDTQEITTTVKVNKLKPRIAIEDENETTSTLTFTDMDFADIIGRYYGDYQTLVRKATTMKIKLRIPMWKLKDFDFTVPIWLERYQRRYAVISIASGANDIYEFELIQL